MKPKEREAFAELVIEFIRNRTISGLDKNGKPFPEYTKQYAERKGVGRGDVDLVLSDEMLEALQVLAHKSGSIVIGYDKGDKALNGKVEGNVLGTYGQPKPIKGKKRDFLGISKQDLGQLLSMIEEEEVTDIDIDAIASRAAREMFGEVEFED